MTLDFDRFDALTFDCYGTLIDWETGLLAAMRRVLDAHGVTPADDELLERYARHEAALEAGPYLRYREVLARALAATAAELGVTPATDELAGFGGSVGDWPAFPDSRRRAGAPPGALPARRHHELRRRPVRRLEQAPRRRVRRGRHRAAGRVVQAAHRNFEVAFERVGAVSRASGSSTSPRACSTTTSRPRRSG